MNPMTCAILSLALTALAGCASERAASGPAPAETRWEPVVVWEGAAAFERVRVGRPDARDPALQIVGVDQAGQMVLVHWNGGDRPSAEVVYDNRSEMTGLVIGDVDPTVPGEEIYVGAYEPGQPDVGGCILQCVIAPGSTHVRRIATPGTYVHSIESVPPSAAGQPTRLVASTYGGEIHLLTPTSGDGPWDDRVVYASPPIADPQPKDPRPRIKDMTLLRDTAGRPAHEVFAVFAGGRAVYVDLDHPNAGPNSGRVVAEEEGGWGRTCADAGTGAFACGYKGRVVHFVRDSSGGFTARVIDEEGAESGLRGVVTGRFPLPGARGEIAPLAIFGYHALCRALVERNGAWEPVTLHTDLGRGHTLVAADLVAGNDADELVLAGYSKRIVVLVARREPR